MSEASSTSSSRSHKSSAWEKPCQSQAGIVQEENKINSCAKWGQESGTCWTIFEIT